VSQYNNLPSRAYARREVGRSWRTQRTLHAIDDRTEIILAEVQAAADEAAAVIQARNALAAVAAQADTTLSGLLAALPISDATDADFRSQLLKAARAGAVADIWRFGS
jgi:hypothetical protein